MPSPQTQIFTSESPWLISLPESPSIQDNLSYILIEYFQEITMFTILLGVGLPV